VPTVGPREMTKKVVGESGRNRRHYPYINELTVSAECRKKALTCKKTSKSIAVALHELTWFEVVGWIGVVCYLLAYLLLSLGKMKASNLVFHGLNAIGAIGLIVNSTHTNDTPSVVVNAVWLLIAATMMIKIRPGKPEG
jgi:hypothetical protein